MSVTMPIAVRSSNGIYLISGPPNYEKLNDFPSVNSKSCRLITFSPNGNYLSFIKNTQLTVVDAETWQIVTTLEDIRAYHVAFSPSGTYLMTWEPFTVTTSNPNGSPNLRIYLSKSGELVTSFVHKKQANWEPQWSTDEQLFTRISNTDVTFYEQCNFSKIVHRIKNHKVKSYSLSPTSDIYYILCHTLASPGQPTHARLFKYPDMDNQVAYKNFFQADKVDFLWNSKGTSALLLTSTEVDKTGGSYYGKQTLHYISVTGETAMIPLGKEGSVYNVSWSPKGNEFCAVYGFMPAKATIYNLKCEPVFELGTGPRNCIHYNPHGNILMLGGFGNLRGQVEFWDTNKRTIIGKCEAPDSTYVEWCPNGVHLLTATTAPRLRIGNGYKIWHYTGTLLHEKACEEQEELYDVCWKKYPMDHFKEPSISEEKVEGIVSSQPQASKEVYRPPSARNKTIQFKLHDDDEPAHKPGTNLNPSKATLKQRKKREARKARKEEEGTNDNNKPTATSNVQVLLTGDLEKDKKIKNIKKKLDAIEKLKEQQGQGKTLEVNQIAKIKSERDLLNELQQLQI